jgi:hypothetical protein
VRDILCRMRGKMIRRLLWSVKKLWTAVEPIMCYSSKLLYEHEATVSNKIFSADRPRRFSDKPEFFETFFISIFRELWLSELYFMPMQVFHAACLSWQCVRLTTISDKADALLLFHWGSLRKTMKAVWLASVPVDVRSGYLLKTKNCFTRWKVVLLYRGAVKSLARPGRKQATATEDFEFHISYL